MNDVNWWDSLYLIFIVPLVAMELYAAFGREPKLDTISTIVTHWEKRKPLFRWLLAIGIGTLFAHLIFYWQA